MVPKVGGLMFRKRYVIISLAFLTLATLKFLFGSNVMAGGVVLPF